MGRIRRWLNRAREGFPLLKRVAQTTRNVVLGDTSGLMDSGLRVFLLNVARKATAAGVAVGIRWVHDALGWDLVTFFGPDFESKLIDVILVWAVFRFPNLKPTTQSARAPG
jgi:hypothetical protein